MISGVGWRMEMELSVSPVILADVESSSFAPKTILILILMKMRFVQIRNK